MGESWEQVLARLHAARERHEAAVRGLRALEPERYEARKTAHRVSSTGVATPEPSNDRGVATYPSRVAPRLQDRSTCDRPSPPCRDRRTGRRRSARFYRDILGLTVVPPTEVMTSRAYAACCCGRRERDRIHPAGPYRHRRRALPREPRTDAAPLLLLAPQTSSVSWSASRRSTSRSIDRPPRPGSPVEVAFLHPRHGRRTDRARAAAGRRAHLDGEGHRPPRRSRTTDPKAAAATGTACSGSRLTNVSGT